MTDDIVARLRLWSDWLDDRCPDTAVMSDLREAADEIERLRAERDEARRAACKDEAIIRLQRNRAHRDSEEVVLKAKEISVERGWDCFKEGGDV